MGNLSEISKEELICNFTNSKFFTIEDKYLCDSVWIYWRGELEDSKINALDIQPLEGIALKHLIVSIADAKISWIITNRKVNEIFTQNSRLHGLQFQEGIELITASTEILNDFIELLPFITLYNKY